VHPAGSGPRKPWILGAPLPDVYPGDVIAFLEIGAYQDVSASNFNAPPRPATVLVSGTEAEIICGREDRGDVYSHGSIPARLLAGPAGHDRGGAR
jgi:diaminopimelate decarboxylase